jgi:hypothetical protein
MTTLLDAYRRWSDEPFPPGSIRDDIDELHADLATVDHWVADMVIPYVEDGRRFPLKVDIDGGLQHLRRRLLHLRASASGKDLVLRDRYSKYAALLDAVFRAYETDPLPTDL